MLLERYGFYTNFCKLFSATTGEEKQVHDKRVSHCFTKKFSRVCEIMSAHNNDKGRIYFSLLSSLKIELRILA